MAADLDGLLADPTWAAEAGLMGRLFGQWALVLLKGPCRQNTVRAYLSRVGRGVDAGLLSDVLFASTASQDAATNVGRIVALYRTRESQRSALRVLRAFLAFAEAQGYPIARQVKWGRLARHVDGDTRAATLLRPSELRATADALRALAPDGLALAASVVLGGCAGLRRTEACNLAVGDIQRESDWVVRVRRSKTQAGARFVPLGVLAPRWAMDILRAYDAHRATRPTAGGTWLLTAAGTAWSADPLGERVSRMLTKLGTSATFHSLRRACATWWLVRWISLDRNWVLPTAMDADGPPAAGVVAILGRDANLVLWSLARLLGHVEPAVTIERYVLALHWIETQVLSDAADATVSLRMAATVLGVTERRARALVTPDAGAVHMGDLLAAARCRLRSVEGHER
jgi:integrase